MIGRLESKHWALIGGFVVAVSVMIGGLDHWSDALHPAFVAGFVAQLGVLIGALFAGAPPNPNLNDVVNPARRATDPIPPETALGSVSDATRRNLL